MTQPLPERASLTYRDAGVDTLAGGRLADELHHLCLRTHGPRVFAGGMVKGMAGLFRLDFNERLFARNYKDPVLTACTNGVGTKVKIAAALKRYDTVGLDLVAMNVNDLIVQGGEPLIFLHYIAQHKVDPGVTAQLVKGISDGCLEANAALLGGETAEMPSVYGAGDFDMAGFAVGVVERKKILDGSAIEPGDSVIGLASSGLHANGYALVRHILAKTGVKLTAVMPEINAPLGEELLKPSRIYVGTITKLLAKYKVKQTVKAMVHVTSGGLPAHLARVLPAGLAVRLKRDAWPVPPIFHYLAKAGPVDDMEMLNVFNMGIGFVLIVRPTFTKPIMTHLRTLGERAYFLGKVRKAEGPTSVEWS